MRQDWHTTGGILLKALAMLGIILQALLNSPMGPSDAGEVWRTSKEWIRDSVLFFGKCADIVSKGAVTISESLSSQTVKIRRTAHLLFIISVALVGTWLATPVQIPVDSKATVPRSETGADAYRTDRATSFSNSMGSPVNFQLRSARGMLTQHSVSTRKDIPLAVLRIPKINLQIPVFNGTDDLILNRGAGRILGTAQIGQAGNLGIAGFFRGVQKIALGDAIELARPGHTDEYIVRKLRIVTPQDIYVLDPTSVPTLTLVTCFPFDFIGHPPQRFIVTARLERARRYELTTHVYSIAADSAGEYTERFNRDRL